MNRKFILILLSVVAAIALLVFAVACGRTVTVTFDEGGATKTVSVKSGSVVQDYTPQKDGYEFSCWTEKESGAELIFAADNGGRNACRRLAIRESDREVRQRGRYCRAFSDVRQRRLRFSSRSSAERIQSVCGLVQAGRGRAF